MSTAIFERDPGTVNEILDSVGHQHFLRASLRRDPRRDVDCDSADVVTSAQTLAGVQPAAYVQTDLRHAFGERRGAEDRPGWAIECREQAIAGVLHESALV